MHPAIFIGGSALLGALFALQEWISSRLWNYHLTFSLLLSAWGLQYLLWGVLCWLLWWKFRPYIERAGLRSVLLVGLPVSILASVAEEMIWILFFPRLPLGRPPMPYWQRLAFHLDAEIVDSMVIFWSAFFLFRGIGYYRKFRERERVAAQLETQLVNAQMRALRMQLNPHFLFNTMNSISSLMRVDVGAADSMLEQLSSLLRITLDRGETQMITLSDEMEFIGMYLAMQGRRFAGRITEEVRIDSELHDALLPNMILQPIVENAFRHGLSRLDRQGALLIEATRDGSSMQVRVRNSGIGLNPPRRREDHVSGVGLANVKERLAVHYGEQQSFAIREIDGRDVEVTITLPLQLSAASTRVSSDLVSP